MRKTPKCAKGRRQTRQCKTLLAILTIYSYLSELKLAQIWRMCSFFNVYGELLIFMILLSKNIGPITLVDFHRSLWNMSAKTQNKRKSVLLLKFTGNFKPDLEDGKLFRFQTFLEQNSDHQLKRDSEPAWTWYYTKLKRDSESNQIDGNVFQGISLNYFN